MILDDYILQNKIGEGAYGEVFYSKKRDSDLVFATKKVEKNKILSDKLKQYFMNEVQILDKLNHPNIIKLYEIKTTHNNIYLITEYCNGGTLTDNLSNYQKIYGRPFTENIGAHILKQIAEGIHYMNKNNIIHRDMKMENILLHYDNEDDKKKINILKAKIIDFGFARYLGESNLAKSVVGSPLNMAPDVLHALTDENWRINLEYNEKVDIWAIGVIIFNIIVGKPPFNADNCADLYNKVDQGLYTVPKELKLSKEAIKILNGMLMYDVKKRLSVEDILKHDFLIKAPENFEQIDFSKLVHTSQNQNYIFLDIKTLINFDSKPEPEKKYNNVDNTYNKNQINQIPPPQTNTYFNYNVPTTNVPNINIPNNFLPNDFAAKNYIPPYDNNVYYMSNYDNTVYKYVPQPDLTYNNYPPQTNSKPNVYAPYNNVQGNNYAQPNNYVQPTNNPVNYIQPNNNQGNNYNTPINNYSPSNNGFLKDEKKNPMKFPEPSNIPPENYGNKKIVNNPARNDEIIKLDDYKNIKDYNENANKYVAVGNNLNYGENKKQENNKNSTNIMEITSEKLDSIYYLINKKFETFDMESIPIFLDNPEKYEKFIL